MPEGLLNYVRCPHCGGNLADLNHPCDEDARAAAAERAVAEMFAPLDGEVRIPKDPAAYGRRQAVIDAAKAWYEAGAGGSSPDGQVHRANRDLRRAVAALGEDTDGQ